MSWVKGLSQSGEDVFDECADEFSLLDKEWTSMMKKRVRDGYVDGVDAGEEASLQVGFKLGFSEGAAQTAAVGRLKGIVSALLCWSRIHHLESASLASVTELLQQIAQYESTVLDGIRKALENPPPSVTSVSESMEDLEVEQANTSCCGEGCKEKASGCCRGGEKMDLDAPNKQQKPSSGSTDCASSSSERLNCLLQRCMDLVSELGLPQELRDHIQELKNLK